MTEILGHKQKYEICIHAIKQFRCHLLLNTTRNLKAKQFGKSCIATPHGRE